MSFKVTRRSALRSLAAGLAAPAIGRPARNSRPNVLFLAIDDLNDWIGTLHGHPQTITPNIDSIAGGGVSFTRAYCQAPMCNPSRASLMSGLRPSTSGCYGNGDYWRDAMPDAVTIPQYFIRNGYKVLGGGKIFHGSQNEAKSWQAYRNFGGFLHPLNTPVNGIPNTRHFDWGGFDAPDEETAGTQLAMWAGDFLQRDHDKPFFLACGFYRPHLPWYAPKRYFDKFPEDSIQLPPFLENDLDDVPNSAVRSLRDHDNVTSRNQWKRAVASYLACINYTDANVGRVLEALARSPHKGNTVVVLWTDHGWHLGEKKHWRKFTLWERSCRVPLMFQAPGVTQAGGKCGRTVELIDIYPTLIDLCGLPAKTGLDGETLRPLLQQPSSPWDRPAITSLGPDKTSVRTERYRYTQYSDGEELYDHTRDPNEWHNLAGDPQFAGVKKDLAARVPKNRSRKKVKLFNDLPDEQKNILVPPAGRHQMSDPENVVDLPETI